MVLIIVTAVIALWVISLCRIVRYSSRCLASDQTFVDHGPANEKRNVLFVIAHPDDESMFFVPTILFLNSEGHKVHILCMSNGNAEGIGRMRKEELYRACTVLKVPVQQVKVLDHPNLQDGFNKPWDHHLLAKFIEDAMKEWNIDMLISFDDIGVSGHPNHCDVHHGVRMLLRGCSSIHIDAWELVSKSICNKYIGPVNIWLPILYSLFGKRTQVCYLLNNQPWKTYSAMVEHESQLVWFRKLFVLFSSYTYINTLQKVNITTSKVH